GFYDRKVIGANQQVIQASEIKAQVESFSVNMSNKKRPHVVIPTLVPELEPEKEVPILSVNYITEEEAKNWDSPNAQKPIERIEPYKANDLDGCKTLFHDLELNDPEAICLLTLKELESEGSSKPKTQSFRKSNKSKNLINKEFERLEEIKGHEKFKKDLEFKEQEEL
ncbi:21267_t:CDS:2, partial [Rhizophagus irregularis]